MTYIHKHINYFIALLGVVGVLAACNKELPEAVPLTPPAPSGQSIMEKMDDTDFSWLKAAITRASTFNNPSGSLSSLLGNKARTFTFFAPDNTALATAFTLLGLPAEQSTINLFRPGQLDTILRYHLIGGERFTASRVTPVAPSLNLYLQSSFVLQAPSAALPPGLRMPIFVGKQGAALFANNIPVTQPDIALANGTVHKIAIALLPPSQVLWQRVATDPDLTYLLAAVLRGDTGDPAKTLENALKNPAANLTLFAPSNAAFQAVLTAQITQGIIPIVRQGYITTILVPAIMAGDPDISEADALAAATIAATTEPHVTNITNAAIGQATVLASTPDVFTNPLLASVLTPETVKGLVVYHIMGNRAFSVNLPTTVTNLPTLLNGAIAAHPGIGVQATFGPTGVTAVTVKGLGNATAANVAINPLPGTGTSDQHFINGALHKINQVLLPQ